MKISIKNFKSIQNLEEFELKPLTILSGNNSSGKSSFIQLLLILKQTLEIGSSKKQLFIHGDYYKAKSQTDLITGKKDSKTLTIDFLISKEEFKKFGDNVIKSLYDSFSDYTCKLNLVFGFMANELKIKRFYLEYTTAIKPEFLLFEVGPQNNFKIESNNDSYFLSTESSQEDGPDFLKEIQTVNYSSFFPISYEESIQAISKDPKGRIIHSNSESITRLNINSIKSFLEIIFNELYYIGPLRIEPQDTYAGDSEKSWVGVKGEFTAQLLETMRDEMVECNVPKFEGDLIKFRKKQMTLLDASNIWICNIFKFGKRLYAKEIGDAYSVYLVNDLGIETTLKHVGFGISQILPIVVQGLLMKKGDTLILEQPEIHLHPKIQSALFDFLYSLTLQGKNFIVETHSDHFITRLRRRVAEDESSQLLNQINLTFIEKQKKGLTFKKVKLDDLGVYEIYPEDFIENPEKELMALLDAQMKKRKSKRNQSEVRSNN